MIFIGNPETTCLTISHIWLMHISRNPHYMNSITFTKISFNYLITNTKNELFLF